MVIWLALIAVATSTPTETRFQYASPTFFQTERECQVYVQEEFDSWVIVMQEFPSIVFEDIQAVCVPISNQGLI